jgi:cold shock protein
MSAGFGRVTGIRTAHRGSEPRALEEDGMAPVKGTIKRIVSGKGFGFIATEDGSEYFFHQSSCTEVPFDELREGQAITFEKGQGPKGPRGENVRPA